MISLEILNILIPLQKMLKNVADLGKLIVAKALKSCPKSNISPNLVTLHRGKYHCTPDLLFDRFGFDQTSKNIVHST